MPKSARFGIFILVLAALATGFGVGYSALNRPTISALTPLVVDPGGTVVIAGRHFGPSRGESRVEVDGVAPTSSSYLSWSDSSIRLRLPPTSESGLVYVITRHGRSNAKLFLNRARLPVAALGEGQPRNGPFISSLSAEKGPIGSLLVVSGLNFGANRGGGAVYFGWNPEGSGTSPDDRADSLTVAAPDVDLGYELWSDKEIRVRVPDGASSGSLVVATDSGRSNPVFYAVTDMPGQKHYKDRRSYTIDYSVSITKVKAGSSNELYLWVPRPIEAAYQRIARVLNQEPAPFVPEYHGCTLYQFKDLSAGQDLLVDQSFLVQTWAVETSVDPDSIAKPDNPPALIAAYTAADDLVPSQAPEVQAIEKNIVGGERNPWRAARMIYTWLAGNLSWNPQAQGAKAIAALQSKNADSGTYALAACALLRAAGVPSLPVEGYLVDPSRKAVRHAWVEFYIYGLGWVPMDPILGSGANPGGFPASFDDRTHYFGNLDNRRIAFSRGYTVFSPMSPAGRRASPQRPLALQNFYEESTGDLEAYSSFWSEVEISGLY